MNDPFSVAAIQARRDHLLAEPSRNAFAPALPYHGDHQLNPDIANAAAARPAAVLVALVTHPEGLKVLLSRRAAAMRDHSGQIAFPGGKLDEGDGSVLACALREAREEIGLKSQHIETIGYLDPYQTGTGFRIQPVVALVTPPLLLAIHPGEVDEAFEVPLEFLMNPVNHLRHSRHWNGRERFFYAISYQDYYIWGATAGILRNLYERLFS